MSTAEGVRLLVVREGRRHIDHIELALLANTKTDEVETFVVPGLGGPDFDAAMSYLQWVVAELTQHGIEIALHYRPTPEGVAIGLEDITERKNA